MDIQCKDVNNWTVVRVQGERLDVKSVPRFKECISPLINQHIQVVLDMSAVQFVDSTGIGVLLQFMKQLNEVEATLKLCGIQQQVDAMFKLVHMDTMFVICKSIEEVTGLY